MRRAWMTLALVLGGCSLIVPGPDEFTYGDGTDAGPGRDAGPEADAGPEDDGGPPADAGPDAGPTCASGETVCDGSCVDTATSLEHCGGCGNACRATDRCVEGSCFDPVVEVDAALRHTCARRASGQVWCWGLNTSGELGDDTMLDRLAPVRVADLENAEEITVGWGIDRFGSLAPYGWSCARLADGSVRCWGENFLGQLGDGTTEDRRRPTAVSGLGSVRSVGAGLQGRTCAVSADRQLLCWGGLSGSMPVGPEPLRPTSVSGGWAQSVEVGTSSGCALGLGDEVYCWGANGFGQLGDGTTASSDVPVPSASISSAREVSVSSLATCARLADGTVACWGREDALGAGLGTMDPHPAARTVPGLSDVVAIDALDETCAVHGEDRRLTCWGDSTSTVEGLTGISDVAVGAGYKCVVLLDGTVWCWGANDAGQLGDGTTEERTEPTRVVGL